MIKKFVFFISIIFIIFSLTIDTYNDNYINTLSYQEDDEYFHVDNLIPKNGEENVICTPEIKIFYNSKNIPHDFKLFLNYKNITNKCIMTSKYIYYKCDDKLKRGLQVVNLEVNINNTNKKKMDWYFTVGTPFFNHYKGIFFNNTNQLNKLTSYEDLNNLYKNNKHLDYIFITEEFNNTKNIVDTHFFNNKWKNLTNCCSKHSFDDEFVSIPGFQMNLNLKDKKKTTKINIYNVKTPFVFKGNFNLQTLYKKLFYYNDDLICQFKYNSNLDNIDYFKYSSYGDSIISLLELNKNENLDLNIYKEALDNGWHLSPITCIYNKYPNINASSNLYTTILSQNLNRNEILNAIKENRLYVSESDSIKIFYSLNKMPMGSVIKSPSYIRIIVSAINNNQNNKIKQIEVFSNNNQIVYNKNFKSNLAKIDFLLKPPNKNTYYFAVITDYNNKKSITSPIWIEN